MSSTAAAAAAAAAPACRWRSARAPGPAGGGTVVTVEIVGGVPAGAAAAAKCRFGPTEIDSNPVLDGDTVVDASEVDGALECTSPPDTSDGRVVTLEVSLNAQEYSTGGGEFCYIAAPDTVPTGTARRTQVAGGGLDAITPLFGPAAAAPDVFARGADRVPHGCHWAVDDEPKECRAPRGTYRTRRTAGSTIR